MVGIYVRHFFTVVDILWHVPGKVPDIFLVNPLVFDYTTLVLRPSYL